MAKEYTTEKKENIPCCCRAVATEKLVTAERGGGGVDAGRGEGYLPLSISLQPPCKWKLISKQPPKSQRRLMRCHLCCGSLFYGITGEGRYRQHEVYRASVGGLPFPPLSLLLQHGGEGTAASA